MSRFKFWSAWFMVCLSMYKYITTGEVEWLIVTWIMNIYINLKENDE